MYVLSSVYSYYFIFCCHMLKICFTDLSIEFSIVLRKYRLCLSLIWKSKIITLLSISLKTVIGIFQIVNNRGVVTQLFLVKLEIYTESLQRMSLNEC